MYITIQHAENINHDSACPFQAPRLVALEDSMGIRVTGGNDSGLGVSIKSAEEAGAKSGSSAATGGRFGDAVGCTGDGVGVSTTPSMH
mmetsp:Transcript_29843/g.45887  ORF Transcript_29843/g.45887 Transcript_29843/m.45887 type:complete len:88 (-) Transcript_29843:213-476(-)